MHSSFISLCLTLDAGCLARVSPAKMCQSTLQIQFTAKLARARKNPGNYAGWDRGKTGFLFLLRTSAVRREMGLISLDVTWLSPLDVCVSTARSKPPPHNRLLAGPDKRRLPTVWMLLRLLY